MAMSRSSRLIVSALLCLAVAAGLQGGCVAADEAEAPAESGPYAPPAFKGTATLLETFQDDVFEAKRAYKSTESNYVGQTMELGEATDDGALAAGIKGDNGLVLTKAAQRYGVLLPYADGASAVIEAGADAEGEAGAAFVLQYEVRLSQGLDCGGAYVKVLEDRDDLDATALKDDTPYIIMFGPDKCGATNKVHFILRHRNPVNGEWSEHHLASPPTPKTDRNSHLYTLVVRRDNSFEILIDAKSVKAGSLLEDLEPPVNPPEEIDDPDDEKPADWVDEAKIKDPEAKKPDDWDEDAPKKIEDPEAVKPDDWLDDEPAFVPDPDAAMPDDWDEDEDGEWEAPSVANPKCEAVSGCGEWKRPVIANPAYKGKWTAPMIDNPEYKGVWEPRKIPNPAHFVDEHPAALPKTAAVAVEIWTMSAGIAFDNILVTDDEEAAADYAEATWAVKHARQESEAKEAKRAKDRAEREKKLAEGGFMNTFNYYLVELTEAAVDNPVISISCIVVAVIAIFYGCLRMAGGDDDDMPIRPTSAADVAATAPGPAADDGKAGAAGKAEGTAAADDGADDAADADADADAGDADASGSGSEAEATEGKAEGETPGGSVRQRHKGKPSRRRTPKTGD